MTTTPTSASASAPPPPPTTALTTVDSILSYYSKYLKPGESISIPLIKGKHTTTSIDPLLLKARFSSSSSAAAAAAAAASNSNVNSTNVSSSSGSSSSTGTLLDEKFPKIAKFIETVEKPDFQGSFQGGRLYQEDIPKIQDDSDDEDNDSKTDHSTTNNNPRKKKRSKRQRPPRQHWVLQTDDEFIHKLKVRVLKQKNPTQGALIEHQLRNKLSNRYEGLPESNNSHYVLFSASSSTSENVQQIPAISVTPMHGYISFTQPAKFKTLSMQDAENAIASKNVSRYMMHTNNSSNSTTTTTRQVKLKSSRDRLLNSIHKDNNNNEDEEDDVMMDVAFREERAGVSLKTRQELLDDFGDSGIKVDHDGILGGANDSEFAGGRRFGLMKIKARKDQNGGDGNKRTKAGTFDGGNGDVDDDFYQKDVGAQFENVDCDLDALFDNNDEYMGAGDQDDYDLGGFADAEDDDSDGEDDDDDVELGLGTKSFATKTGMEAIFAKATGENIELQTKLPVLPLDVKGQRKSGNLSSGSDRSEDEKDTVATKRKSPEPSTSGNVSNVTSAPPISQNTAATPSVMKSGLRIISKESVRKEIWLHSGSIPATQLLKKFKANGKKNRERKKVLLEIITELCTMEGDVLTLKQHYAKYNS